MSSTTKSQKDKPHGTSPRLLPRATAASTARAARNACNRNLNPSLRQSPSRASASSLGLSKERSLLPRASSSQKSDSKTDIKEQCLTPRSSQKTDSKTEIRARSQTPRLTSQKCDSKTDIKMEPTPLDLMNITVIVTETTQIETEEYTTNATLQDIVENDFFGNNLLNMNLQKPHEPGDIVERQDIFESQSEFPGIEEESCRPTPEQSASRPATPKSSRAETPRSSRPGTPRAPSRPATPAAARHAASSRPNTPQRIPIREGRPTTPRTPAQPPQPSHAPAPPLQRNSYNRDEDEIKNAYIVKQKQFNRMKKELDLKQQALLEVFDTLRALRERMCREGGAGAGAGAGAGGEGLGELVVFNVGDWTADELAQLCRDAAAVADVEEAHHLINTTMPIDECALQELDSKVSAVPARFADLCLQAFTGRQELIDWIKELIENNALREEFNGSGECLERIARYNVQGLELCEALKDLKGRAEDAVDTVTQLSRRACRERSALVAVGESLVREIARLRQDVDMRMANMAEMQELRIESEAVKALEETRRKLDEERASRASNHEKLATAEAQLRQMRARVAKMDRQLREAEASITSLTSTVKALEDQSRQKEVQMEARARKLKESLKTGEMTTGHLAQQRDSLQNEIATLKDQIANMTAQHKSALQELTNQLKESKTELDALRKDTRAEIELRESAEAALAESRDLIEALNKKITKLENSMPDPDLPTEREMDLRAELQATKDTLRLTEDEVTACKREKVRFLETLTKIAETENKVGMQQKLAGELLSKEEIMGKMQIQIRELTKNIKLNEQKVIQYEQYVSDLQAHNRAVANCLETPNGISYEDLQQEIMSLKMKLLESVHRNEELSELLVQKEQQIEQQDKTSRAQARVIKVREELINMLKNKETEQSKELTALQQDLENRMKIVDKVNKQIAAKADEIQELFGTLENKQQQIHRLEKIVIALEEQQRRGQAQRIRHEEKIAALEHELASGGNRRERKFLFF